MTSEKPKYWDSWKGLVIRAIVQRGCPLTWKEILEITELSPQSLKRAVAELYQLDQIKKVENVRPKKYKVCPELYREYKDFFKKQKKSEESGMRRERPQAYRRISSNRKDEIVNWINQWKAVAKLDFSIEPEHFFLEGRHLDSISKGLISDARTEVLVANPYVADCDLSDTLRNAGKRGVEVRLVTRPPSINGDRYSKERKEYHSRLKKEGIILAYNKKVHAKLIAVDQAVAIVSSMNFYSGSSAGSSWEAGLVTIEETVVKSVVNSIRVLLRKPESKRLQ